MFDAESFVFCGLFYSLYLVILIDDDTYDWLEGQRIDESEDKSAIKVPVVTIAFLFQAKRLITNEFAAIKVIKLEPGIVDVNICIESCTGVYIL